MSIKLNPELLRSIKNVSSTRSVEVQRGFWEKIFAPVTKFDLYIFTSELKSTLLSGLEITRSLSMMQEQVRKPLMKDIIRGLLFNISQGKKVSAAFSAYPWFFDNIYIASIKVGEENGRLPEILQSLEKAISKQIEINRKIVGALVYPIIAFIVCVIFTLITFKYIMPGIMEFVSGLDADIPPPTKLVMFLTSIADNPYSSLWFIILLGISVYLVVKYLSMPRGRYVVDEICLRLPIVRDVVKKLNYVSICSTLSTLIDAGVPITNAFRLAASSCSNTAFVRSCNEAANALESGELISDYFKRDQFLYDSIFSGMFIVGEESGSIPDITSALANMYETDLDNFFNSISSVIEPIMILFVGSIIGFIVLSVFLPLYSVFQNM